MHYDDNNNHTYNQTASDRSKPPNPHPNFFLEKKWWGAVCFTYLLFMQEGHPNFFSEKKNDGVQFVLHIFYL